MQQKEEKILFAAADCTGHGIPGALVSVICNDALNQSVEEHNLIEPGKILDKTRDIIVHVFEKSEEDVKDGMDISLCVLDKAQNTLQWAGANNPIWIIRNGEIQESHHRTGRKCVYLWYIHCILHYTGLIGSRHLRRRTLRQRASSRHQAGTRHRRYEFVCLLYNYIGSRYRGGGRIDHCVGHTVCHAWRFLAPREHCAVGPFHRGSHSDDLQYFAVNQHG